MSHGCGSTKRAQLAGETLSCSGRELPWLSLGASTQLGTKPWSSRAGLGSCEGCPSKAAAFCACLPGAESPAAKGPHRLPSTGTSSFLRLQLPGDTVKEKPPTSPPCLPGQASTGAFPISVHAWFPAFCSVPSIGVVLLLLFTVQAPVQQLLSVMAANPPHSLLTEADQHIRFSSYTLMPLYFHFFPILVFSWRAGVGGALSTAVLSCG